MSETNDVTTDVKADANLYHHIISFTAFSVKNNTEFILSGL